MKSLKSIIIVAIFSGVVVKILSSMVGFHVTADNFVWATSLTALANLGFMYVVDMILRIRSTDKELKAKMDAITEMNERKPVQVRPVCGGLDESMGKVATYLSFTGFILDTCCNDEFKQYTDMSKFTTKYQGPDARTGWDTWVILYDGAPIAYSNGELK